jgi:hypothetical protein
LEAADCKSKERQEDEREPKQLTLEEHKALFAKLQGPKRIGATQSGLASSVLVASQIRFSEDPESQDVLYTIFSHTCSRGGRG